MICFLIHCQASHTQISKQNSTKLSQTSLPKNWGTKNVYICPVFRRVRHFMANIFGTKQDIDDRAKALESTRGPLYRPKISWTFVHKRLKIGPKFLLTLSILFRPQFIAHPLSGIKVAPRSDSKWNGIGFVCSSDSEPQNRPMFSWKCYRVGQP